MKQVRGLHDTREKIGVGDIANRRVHGAIRDETQRNFRGMRLGDLREQFKGRARRNPACEGDFFDGLDFG